MGEMSVNVGVVMGVVAGFVAIVIISLIMLVCYNAKRVSQLPQMEKRLQAIEDYLAELSKDIEDNGAPQPIYRSTDGKHWGHTFEELLEKMANDPETPLSESDKRHLREAFERVEQEDTDMVNLDNMGDVDPDDDDEDDDEPWKKK